MQNPFMTMDPLSRMPVHARIFIFRSILLFVGWKFLYLNILMPLEVPDAWLVRTLGDATVRILNAFPGAEQFSVIHARRFSEGGSGVWETHSVIFRAGNVPVLGIHQPCNGLELMVLAAGFIISFYGCWKRKLGYIIFGAAGILLANVVRCCMLSAISIHFPDLFEFTHRYLFNLIVYSFTFFLWKWYVEGAQLSVRRKPIGREKGGSGYPTSMAGAMDVLGTS